MFIVIYFQFYFGFSLKTSDGDVYITIKRDHEMPNTSYFVIGGPKKHSLDFVIIKGSVLKLNDRFMFLDITSKENLVVRNDIEGEEPGIFVRTLSSGNVAIMSGGLCLTFLVGTGNFGFTDCGNNTKQIFAKEEQTGFFKRKVVNEMKELEELAELFQQRRIYTRRVSPCASDDSLRTSSFYRPDKQMPHTNDDSLQARPLNKPDINRDVPYEDSPYTQDVSHKNSPLIKSDNNGEVKNDDKKSNVKKSGLKSAGKKVGKALKETIDPMAILKLATNPANILRIASIPFPILGLGVPIFDAIFNKKEEEDSRTPFKGEKGYFQKRQYDDYEPSNRIGYNRRGSYDELDINSDSFRRNSHYNPDIPREEDFYHGRRDIKYERENDRY